MSKNTLMERMIARGVNIHNPQEVFEFFHTLNVGEGGGGGLTEGEIKQFFDQWSAALVLNVQQIGESIPPLKNLAETNQLNLSKKANIEDLESANEQIELNRLALLNKSDLTALSMLAALVGTKADQHYVQEQIANLVNGDKAMIAAIQEISAALSENEGLFEALEYTVANRVRFDISTQALTALQKDNARINIGAEEKGTAALLISSITAQSLGAATAAQGLKANTALQSGDVAPVALNGLFSSLAGQNRIYDVVYSAYQAGANAAITASDSLGVILSKLQAQINNKPNKVQWVDVETVGIFNHVHFGLFTMPDNTFSKVEVARINGNLWVRGAIRSIGGVTAAPIFTIQNKDYKVENPDMLTTRSIQFQVYRSDGIYQVQYQSSAILQNEAQALSVEQSLYFRGVPPASQTIPVYIPPTCLGMLYYQ